MKKTLAILLTLIMLATCAPTAFAKVDNAEQLPFVLAPSKTVSMSKVYEDVTDTQFNFSTESDIIQFLQDCEDPDKKAEILNRLGVEEMWINAQIDWAIDDPTDWHHTQYWDDNEATRYFELGYDENGQPHTYEWDVVAAGVEPKSTNNCWITRYAGNPLSNDEERWNGRTYYVGEEETPVHINGMKDVLKPGQYSVVEDEPGEGHITIDYTKHTVYARMRYVVTIWNPVYDGEGQQTGTTTQYMFSDWSQAAAYGKDAPKWTPPTAQTLDTPQISDLTVSEDEDFNNYPVVYYTQTVSDELSKDLTEVEARGGYISVYPEARVKGASEWRQVQGDWNVRSGRMSASLLHLNGDNADGTGKALLKGTEIEFRVRYYCYIRLEYGGDVAAEFWSGYSDVLTAKLPRDYSDGPVVPPDDATAPTEPPIHNLNNGASESQVVDYVEQFKSEADPAGGTFGLLSACQKSVTTNKIVIKWNKLKKAKTYMVFSNKCGKKNPYKLIATVKGTSYTNKKLTKGTYYKYLVVAFDSKGKSIATSKTLHIATKGGKVCNFKTVTTAAKKNKVTLKKGKSFKLKAKAIIENKKLEVRVHRKLKYESSNPKIATVAGGKITAKKKGTCYVYVYAQSGAYKKIKVTVK